MKEKTCEECKWFEADTIVAVCNKHCLICNDDNEACGFFEPKVVTNGDKIVAGGMRAIAELYSRNKCSMCIYPTYEEDVGFGEAGWTCNCPKDKTCTDGIEAWLNAPADCVAENGESAKQTDLSCKSAKESEGKDE